MAYTNSDFQLTPEELSSTQKKLETSNGDVSHPEKPKVAETWGEVFTAWPKITFCIVVNEFCERFSYYGMRTVLTLYLLNILKFSARDSSTFFNTFSSLCYLSPILGAIIADGFLGKFLTIFLVSILYAVGQIILTFVSTRSHGSGLHPWIDFLGLFIIAMGTGGIKPCVSPFGGDQFDPHQTKMISIFFSVFYFSINAGSMISTFITPIFRATPCLNQDTCYPLAFGIPAILMIVATVAFMAGSFWYKKSPPKSNVFKDVAVVIKRAISNKMGTGEKRKHWLDHALTNHTCERNTKCQQLKRRKRDPSACAEAKFIEDVKSLFRVLIMYVPLPIFWSLYDQQASTWTIQAVAMDSRLWGHMLMLPDQMQVLNAVLILLFIPIFQAIIYPVVGMFFKVTPLRKMVGGGLLAALAYLIAAFIQILVNKTLPIMPSSGHSYVSVINALDGCTLNVSAVGYNSPAFTVIPPYTGLQNSHDSIRMFELKRGDNVTFNFNPLGTRCPSFVETPFTFNIADKDIQYIHISTNGMFMAPISPNKPTEGTGEFSTGIITAFDDQSFNENLVFCRIPDDGSYDENNLCHPKKKADYFFYETNYTTDDGAQTDLVSTPGYVGTGANTHFHATVFKVKSVRPGKWRLYYMKNNGDGFTPTAYTNERRAQGGVYLLSLTGRKDKVIGMEINITPDNGISILWQVPQIVVITAAEILFSITGLEFSYTQAAPTMKAIIGAAFLLTTGIGDMLIVIINLIHFTDNYAVLFLVYAIMMTVVIFIFALMSIFYYEYANYTEKEDDDGGDQEPLGIEDNSSGQSTGSIPDTNKKFYDINLRDEAWNTNTKL